VQAGPINSSSFLKSSDGFSVAWCGRGRFVILARAQLRPSIGLEEQLQVPILLVDEDLGVLGHSRERGLS
jgi:hypothetical protein